MPQQLAPKEAAQFRTVIRSYEDKQYKRGLKTADLILKKYPKHGDTMAMKALILNGQGKTDEAFALGKDALTADMKSHICWHVYGLLYRANKNFEEAIKAYKFALKLEPESQQIQRDLAILQIQMRDYQGYIQSRTAMLQSRPSLRSSWTALAIAHHLAGNLTEAENVLDKYEGTLKASPSRYDVEHSEAIMYKNSIIAEQGDFERALEHLESAAKHNLDRLAVLECRARYLSKVGRKAEAVKAYKALLDRNSDHPAYYEQLAEAMDISPDDFKARKSIYDEYADKSSRCDVARRVPLDFLSGDDFKKAAEAYLTFMLDKGVPSTFANLKHLYLDSFKKQTLADVAEKYLSSNEGDATSKDKGEAAALYYLAQHYDYHLSRDLSKAMHYVDKAIEKDPKSVEFHMTKARIVKHSGDLVRAHEMMDTARKLDLKDRYINSKTVKYLLRINENDKALKVMGLFTRPDVVGGPLADLLDMQCMWYLTEDAEAYARQGNLGLALKRLHAVGNIFDVWQEDQFDFHSFSLRKGQIRAYIDMIRWEDHARDHPFYARAALNAINIYLAMADTPATNGMNGEADGGDASARKKAAKKAKKEQQRLEREAAEKQAKQDPNKASKGDETKKPDEDPLGLQLAATKDPLGEATKFLVPLLQVCPRNLEAQAAGFDVYMRREKFILALRCLNAAAAIDASSPEVHERAISFRVFLDKSPEMPAKVSEVLRSEFNIISADADLGAYNDGYRNKHKDSMPHVVASVRAKRTLGEDPNRCDKELVSLFPLDKITFEQAVDLIETLRRWRSAEAEAIRKAAHAKWPEVTRLA